MRISVTIAPSPPGPSRKADWRATSSGSLAFSAGDPAHREPRPEVQFGRGPAQPSEGWDARLALGDETQFRAALVPN